MTFALGISTVPEMGAILELLVAGLAAGRLDKIGEHRLGLGKCAWLLHLGGNVAESGKSATRRERMVVRMNGYSWDRSERINHDCEFD